MNEENKRIEEQIDETVEEMKKKIEEISKNADKVEGSLSGKAQEVKEKSVDVLNKAIEKVKGMYNSAASSEELTKTLNFVKGKARDLSESASKAFESLKESEPAKKTVEGAKEAAGKVADKVTAVYNDAVDSIKNNEQLKDLGDKVSAGYGNVVKGVEEILNKPEVKEGFGKVKDTTVDIAEKAVAALRDWLKPDGEKENKEEVKEDSEPKE